VDLPSLQGGLLRARGNVEKRLSQVRSEMQHSRETLRVLDEQVAYLRGVADDAETRAAVSQTPLADRIHHDAMEDLRRVRRHRDETAAQIAELTAEQDQLLDRLLQPGR
jgi:flagellar biosynthesis chaperone FliJ